jgi:hypothetical protein
VLVGLSRAPDLVPYPTAGGWSDPQLLRPDQIGAVVAPAGALGGAAVLACAERRVPLIAVRNPCLLQVDAAALGLEVLPAGSYSEAAGLVLALREGIAPAALQRPLPPLRCLSRGGRGPPAGSSGPGRAAPATAAVPARGER